MAGLSPTLLKQLEAAGFYVFRDPPPIGAVGPLKVRTDRSGAPIDPANLARLRAAPSPADVKRRPGQGPGRPVPKVTPGPPDHA